ncbi:MAG: hypothetical protein R3F43_23670 [bacterium]
MRRLRGGEACGDGSGDATDDDCDGVVDEGCVCPEGQPCDTGLDGACAAGTTRCEGGRRCAATATAPEQCNGSDDDCDGMADEDWPQVGTPCPDGLGACAGRGTWACAGDAEVASRASTPSPASAATAWTMTAMAPPTKASRARTPPARPARAPARATAACAAPMAWAWPATPAQAPAGSCAMASTMTATARWTSAGPTWAPPAGGRRLRR